MGIRKKQTEFFQMLAKLIMKSIELETPIAPLEWKRDIETQRKYVARGVSKTMNSRHLDGLAMDFVFLEDLEDDGKINYSPEKYKVLGEFWESLGGIWEVDLEITLIRKK